LSVSGGVFETLNSKGPTCFRPTFHKVQQTTFVEMPKVKRERGKRQQKTRKCVAERFLLQFGTLSDPNEKTQLWLQLPSGNQTKVMQFLQSVVQPASSVWSPFRAHIREIKQIEVDIRRQAHNELIALNFAGEDREARRRDLIEDIRHSLGRRGCGGEPRRRVKDQERVDSSVLSSEEQNALFARIARENHWEG
jgi:hypothetical protein